MSRERHRSLPVVRNADDVMRLATRTAICWRCRWSYDHRRIPGNPEFSLCMVFHGRLCRNVNPEADCVHWEPIPPKPAPRRRPRRRLVLLALVLLAAVALGVVLGLALPFLTPELFP